MAAPLIAPAATCAHDFLAVVADDVTREIVNRAAAQLGWPPGHVRRGGVKAATAFLRTSPAPGVLLVDVSDCPDPLSAMDELANVCEANTRVLAVGAVNDIALYRALIGMGVSDYLVKPVAPEALAEALLRSQASKAPAPAPAEPGRTVAMVGARGGVGVTSLATAIGWGLAHERKRRSVLLDLDLQFGSAALSLDLEPGRGLLEMLSAPERIDSLLVGSSASRESELFRVLSAEEPLGAEFDVATDAARERGLEALLDALADGADGIVMDVPRRLDRMGRAALARADLTAIITDLSLPGLRDAQRLLALTSALRPEGRTMVVANRVGGVAGELPQAEFERGVGAKLDFLVPADPKAAAAAAEMGKSLLAVAPNGPAAIELRRIMESFAGGAAAPVEKPSWTKRLLRR